MTTITLPTLTEQIRCTTYMQHPATGSTVAVAEDGRHFLLMRGHGPWWVEVDGGIPDLWSLACQLQGAFIQRPFKIKYTRSQEYTLSDRD